MQFENLYQELAGGVDVIRALVTGVMVPRLPKS